MTQAAENKPMPGFFDEAVYATGKSRQLRLFAMGFRPVAADQ